MAASIKQLAYLVVFVAVPSVQPGVLKGRRAMKSQIGECARILIFLWYYLQRVSQLCSGWGKGSLSLKRKDLLTEIFHQEHAVQHLLNRAVGQLRQSRDFLRVD